MAFYQTLLPPRQIVCRQSGQMPREKEKVKKKNGQSFADHNQDDNSSHVDYPTPRNMFMMNEVSVTVDCLPRSFLKSKTVLIRRLATRRDNSTMPRRMSILTFMSSPV